MSEQPEAQQPEIQQPVGPVIIAFTDDNNEAHEFYVIDSFEFEGNHYIGLHPNVPHTPEDLNEDGTCPHGAFLMRLEHDGDQDKLFALSEDEFNRVIAFLQAQKQEPIASDSEPVVG